MTVEGDEAAVRGDGPDPLAALPCVPSLLTLMRSVVPVTRSRTKTSATPLVSRGTRFVAVLEKMR